jgi:hypothetical protein
MAATLTPMIVPRDEEAVALEVCAELPEREVCGGAGEAEGGGGGKGVGEGGGGGG